MRYGTDHGNGAICDKCHKKLFPSQIIKIQSKKLSNIEDNASTGIMRTIGKIDLCVNCYDELQNIFIKFQQPRKRRL